MRRGRLKGPSGPTGPWVLGFESGGDQLSVALWRLTLEPGPSTRWRMSGERTMFRGHQHADAVLTVAAELLDAAGVAPAEVALIAAGRGPGGFTGVRVGLATAAGMAAGIGCPIWSVDSLEALSMNGFSDGDSVLCPLIDARRNEAYGAVYRLEAGMRTCLVPARVAPAAEILAAATEAAGGNNVLAFGSGALAYNCNTPGIPRTWHAPRASNTVLLAARAWEAAGRPATGPPIDPAYVRPSDAELAQK